MDPVVSTVSVIELFSPEVRADPYPLFAEMRAADPMHPTPFGGWLVLGHRETETALRDSRFSVDHRKAIRSELAENLGPSPAERGLENVMLFMDPPDHTRLRKLVNKAFTPRHVEAMRPRIEAIVSEILDRVADEREVDIIAELAYPLPVRVIAEMLGVPSEDVAQFRKWSGDVAPILDPVMSEEDVEKVIFGGLSLAQYFDELVAERRAEPRDDMVTELIRAEDEGERLTEEELRSTLMLLLIAGHETTMNLIGNGLYALLRNPDQLERLRAQPELMRSAVEELLRYDGPVHLTARTAPTDIELGDKVVEAGRMAIMMLGAANRDPSVFDHPESLDVARTPNKHLAFSAGGHFCVGATLARIEGQIAFRALLDRFDTIELLEQPQYRDTITLRGLRSLRVSVA